MNISTLPAATPATAEDWVARLQAHDCTREEHLAFEDWLAADSYNVLAYAKAERLYSASALLHQDRQLAIRARNIRQHGHAPARRSWAWQVAAAIGLFGVLGYLTMLVNTEATGQQLATAIGERSDSVLEDGSRLLLDANSAVDVAFSGKTRALSLRRGRVQVEASHDPQRPMIVSAGNGSIRVVGTVFQVQQLEGRVEVSLLQGTVTITTDRGQQQTLSAGQQSGYDNQGQLTPVTSLTAANAQGWTRGLLVFSERPLESILQEANRYSSQQIALAEPGLGGIKVSGAFRAGDQDALVDALVAGWQLQAKPGPDGNITLSRLR